MLRDSAYRKLDAKDRKVDDGGQPLILQTVSGAKTINSEHS